MRKPEIDIEPVAALVQRLGVLLAAGVAPVSGWAYLAEMATGVTAQRVRNIAAAADRGDSISEAIIDSRPGVSVDDSAWRGLAAAWLVATEAGAPLAATLGEFATSLRAIAQNRRDLHTALAGPVATARMVMVLPVIGVLFGLALGFNPLAVLFCTPVGLACLGAGVILMFLARQWNRRLIAAASPRDLVPGLELDLTAIAVSGGASIPRARASVAEARRRCGIDRDEPATGKTALAERKIAETKIAGTGSEETKPDLTETTETGTAENSFSEAGDADFALVKVTAVDEILELSRRAGIPAAALLRSEAGEVRRAARSRGERTAATLAVTLMLPLGLCILPAFMLLGVAPLLISVISSTVTSF